MMEPDERGSASGTGSAVRIPMVVLGGWLGSGKTTLLNRLLRSADAGERIAVLVNDVGEVNLDVDLVASREGDTVELTNGCVCCSIGDSLSATLRDLVLGVRPPDRVVVEASGIAEPDRVADYGDRRRLRPDGIVVAVDATDVVARAADRICGPLVRRQVEAAEVLLVTKADLAADGAVYAEVRFAPSLHKAQGLAPDEVVEAVLTGFAEGSAGTNLTIRTLLTAMRTDTDSPEVAELAVRYRDHGVVGFDIAGRESGYPPTLHLSLIHI